MGSNLIVYKGFEIPKNTSKLARKVLRKLRKQKVIRFTHDDGLASNVRRELAEIAGNIGILFFEKDHEIVLINETKTIKGDKALEKACSFKV